MITRHIAASPWALAPIPPGAFIPRGIVSDGGLSAKPWPSPNGCTTHEREERDASIFGRAEPQPLPPQAGGAAPGAWGVASGGSDAPGTGPRGGQVGQVAPWTGSGPCPTRTCTFVTTWPTAWPSCPPRPGRQVQA